MAKTALSDDDLLGILQSERRQSIGFEHDQELQADREKALQYIKGEMNDMPSLTNRSPAVSTDVSDAVETVLPDIIEIFTGGDDVLTFKPISAQDEEAAKQETEYVKHVIFSENDGFLTLYSMFKDALQTKLGVVKWWWEDHPIKPEMFAGKTAIEVALMQGDGEISDITVDGTDPETGEPTYSFTLTNEEPGGTCKIRAWPSEDFTVARDTVRLPDTTYCAARSRPRAQDLIQWGVDRETVEDLPPYGTTTDQEIQLARDTAGEHQNQIVLEGQFQMRSVEVIEHFVRVDSGDGKLCLYNVLTGGNESILVDRDEVDDITFAALTPYIVPHRFYGQSVADLLMPIQRIKTALLRMWLDSGYFALNQRNTVDMKKINEWTIGDLLRNEPGLPIRINGEGAVMPLSSGELGFDVAAAMEFVSVMGEQRTGIVRNAQGLNPDSLHDTAEGMGKLMQAAQMRMRLIARVFAETGLKDLYLGVHAMLRKHKHQANAKIGGKWQAIDCSKWAERSSMDISVGLGSAGRVQEVAAMQMVVALQEKLIQAQAAGISPVTMVDPQNVYAAVTRLVEKSGEMGAERYFTDPSNAPPTPQQPPPGAAEAQAKSQVDMAKLQQEAQSDAAELAQKSQHEAAKLAQQAKEHDERIALDYAKEHDIDQREVLKLQQAHERELTKIASQERIKAAELANALQIAQISAGVTINTVQVKAVAEADRAAVDLELQDREHVHAHEMAEHAAELAPEPEPKGEDD